MVCMGGSCRGGKLMQAHIEEGELRLTYDPKRTDWRKYGDLLREKEFRVGVSSDLGLSLRTEVNEIILGGENLTYIFVEDTKQREFYSELCKIANVSSTRNS